MVVSDSFDFYLYPIRAFSQVANEYSLNLLFEYLSLWVGYIGYSILIFFSLVLEERREKGH